MRRKLKSLLSFIYCWRFGKSYKFHTTDNLLEYFFISIFELRSGPCKILSMNKVGNVKLLIFIYNKLTRRDYKIVKQFEQ